MSGAETASKEESTPTGEEEGHDFCLCRTAEIVTAYVSCHVVMRSELPGLIESTYRELSRIAKGGKAGGDGVSMPPTPAVPIRSSVTADAIICLEDGKSFKSLRRHIKTSFNLTPDEYRRKWGLPSNYPMVAPNYSLQLRALPGASDLDAWQRAGRGRDPRAAQTGVAFARARDARTL